MLHVHWDTTRRHKGAIFNPRIQNYQKVNVLVLNDEMAQKQKELKHQEKKWLKEATKAWETLSSMNISHSDKEKSILACVLDLVVEAF